MKRFAWMLLFVLSLATVSFAQQPSPSATEWRLYEPQFEFQYGELHLRGTVPMADTPDVERLQEIAAEIARVDVRLQDLHRQQLW